MRKLLILITGMVFSVLSYAEVELVGSWELGKDAEVSSVDETKADSSKSKKTQGKKQKEQKNTQFTCGEKRYCKQMKSCSEAKFHLNQCGLRKLDRDGDGVPCENVCG